MKKAVVVSALALMIPFSTSVHAALASDAVLAFNNGAYGCASGGTYPNCDFGDITVSGSWWAMDGTGDGAFTLSERIPMAMNQGIHIGVAQPVSGQSHAGSATGMENTSIDLAWDFLGNTGMHNTISPVTILSDDGAGTVQLDFSGWAADWNGIEDIDLSGDLVNYPTETGVATVTCGSDCSLGDSFVLDYTAHVKIDDPSGFAGVYYGVHLEGTVSTVPLPAAVWLFASGLLALNGVLRRRRIS